MSAHARLRQWLPAFLSALVTGVALAVIYAVRNPQQPFVLSFVVMLLLTWPIFTLAFQMLWFDRSRTDAEIDKGRDDIERVWWTEAGATAFVTLIGGLICVEYLGAALKISWLSPIGLTHVLVLGLGTFVLSYLWLRARGR